MKPWLQSRTPLQLLWLATATNALVPIGFGILARVPWHNGGARHTLPSLLWSGGGMIVIGVIASLFVEQELKNGIATERWPDQTIESLRKFLTRPIFTALILAIFIAGILCLICSFPHNTIWYWMFYWPGLSIIRIRTLARPERPSQSDRLFTPHEPPRQLHSDLWGTPPRPFSS